MNHDIFISYSSKQKSIADGVCHYLEENGFKCWIAPRDIPVGSEYADLIEEAIKTCKAVVLVFSEAASISKWVKGEINVAFTEDKPILPFRIDETEIAGGFRVMLNQMHWIDAFPHYAKRLPELLESICGLLGRPLIHTSEFEMAQKQTDNSPINESSRKSEAFLLKLSVDETADIFINDERICKIKAGKTHVIDFLERGKLYVISARSLAIRKDAVSFELAVPLFSNEIEKSISFSEMREEREKATKEESEKRKKTLEKASFERWKLKESRKVLIQQYDFVDFECEGICVVGKKTDIGDIKYGLVDEQGFEIVQCVFDNAAPMNEGLAALAYDGQWSYYDKEGVPVLENVSEVPGFFIQGVVPICQRGKYGLIDKEGNLLVQCENKFVYHSTGEFVIVIKKDQEVYLFLHKDNTLKRVAFDTIESEEIVVSVGDRMVGMIPGVIHYSYKADRFIPDTTYCSYRSNRYFIYKGDLIGLLDKDGQILMRCSAQEILPMGGPLYRIRVSDRYGVFDVDKRQTVIPIKYRTLVSINNYYGYSYLSLWNLDNIDSYYLVSEIGVLEELFLKSVFGIINSKDEVVIPMEYLCFTSSWYGVYCFKQIACNVIERDNGVFGHYMTENLRCFAEKSPLPNDSPLAETKITAVLFQLDGSSEHPVWNPAEMLVYENKQYSEYEMDGTPIERRALTIEEKMELEMESEVSFLKEFGYILYKDPQLLENNSCVMRHLDGESRRFCEIAVNGCFGVADEVTRLIILPADYKSVERVESFRNEQNSIGLKLISEDGLTIEIDIVVLSDGSVWINPDARWRYKNNKKKREKLSKKFLPFLSND